MHEAQMKHSQLRGSECFLILFDEFQALNNLLWNSGGTELVFCGGN